MSVWFAIPTCNPDRASETFAIWKRKGYKTAAAIDTGSRQPENVDIVIELDYVGYADAINRLCRDIVRTKPTAIVIGGDDHDPDPDHTAEQVEGMFVRHFPSLFGVMQPTGDGFSGNKRAATCPWIGRGFIERAYGGKGPLWPEYFHFECDTELKAVAEKLGCYVERHDLQQYHHHWTRNEPSQRRRPEHLKRAAMEANAARQLFEWRRENGFPGHECKEAIRKPITRKEKP